MTTLSSLKTWARRELRSAGVWYGHGYADAAAEIEALLQAALEGRNRLSVAAAERFRTLVRLRAREHQPTAYLLGSAWFNGRRYFVDPNVLVPRSLIGEFIEERFAPWLIEPGRVRRILDLGTGSGCIALALAHAFPKARVDASDVSLAALAVATRNIKAQRLTRRVQAIASDGFQKLVGPYDLLVSNPPYATAYEGRQMPPEYRHEPRAALVAGGRGLDLILEILQQAPTYLNPQGLLVVETGNRCQTLARLFPEVPFFWLTHSSGDESVFLLDRPGALQAARAVRRWRRLRTTPPVAARTAARSRRA